MRTVPFCLLSLTALAACGVYDIEAPRRDPDESRTPTSQTPDATSAGSATDNRDSAAGSGNCAGASGAGGAGNAGGTNAGGNAGNDAGGTNDGAGGALDASGGGAGGSGNGGSVDGGNGGAAGGGAAGSGAGGSAGAEDAGSDTGSGGSGGRDGSDAAADSDAPGADGSGVLDGGTARDAAGERADDAPRGDDGGANAWLYTSGNHIYRGASVFHGRGANFHDTRSCNACAYAAPNVPEVERRADELIDNWKANFVRLDLESSASADSRVQWQGVLDDPAYQADIQSIVAHVTAKDVYVLLSLWIEPTTTANELPTDATLAVWRKLADLFKNEPRILYGVTNEPHNDTDETVWTAMNNAVLAIRDVESQAGTPQHIIAVQGTQQWARRLDYYLTHPITAAGGTNIVYETHVYDPATEFNALFEVPGQMLPVIIGEFGEQDADVLMQRAEAAEIPYLAFTFHGRCPPNLLVDNSGGGCGVGMDLVPTAFGQQLKTRLATPW